jgi:hypothetical protein
LFATETPTPTSTFTPTPTSTPSPTPTITPTATPLPTGVTSEEMADGSTLFIDYDNKYQFVMPEEWIVIPLDQDGLTDLLDKIAQDNPEQAETAEVFKSLDTDVFRMAALNVNPEYIIADFGTNITVAAFKDDMMAAMPLSFVTGVLEESFIQSGAKVLTEGVNEIENNNGVEVQYIDIEQTADNVKVTQRLVVFQTDDALISITISVPSQFKDEVLPVSETIGGSIEYLK